MDRSIYGRLLVIVGLAVGVASCGSSTPATPTTPTTPTLVTDPFEGTLNPNGAQTHSFTAAAAGTITVTLDSLTPDETLTVGLSLGTWNGAACTIVIAQDAATRGTTVSGTITSVGNFCVRIYDVGKLTANQNYTLKVTHP